MSPYQKLKQILDKENIEYIEQSDEGHLYIPWDSPEYELPFKYSVVYNRFSYGYHAGLLEIGYFDKVFRSSDYYDYDDNLADTVDKFIFAVEDWVIEVKGFLTPQEVVEIIKNHDFYDA